MGQVQDLRRRATQARVYMWDKVMKAREYIYKRGLGLKSKWVEDVLKDTSSVPTVVRIVHAIF